MIASGGSGLCLQGTGVTTLQSVAVRLQPVGEAGDGTVAFGQPSYNRGALLCNCGTAALYEM